MGAVRDDRGPGPGRVRRPSDERFLPEGPREVVVAAAAALAWVNIQTAADATRGEPSTSGSGTPASTGRFAVPGRPGFLLPTDRAGHRARRAGQGGRHVRPADRRLDAARHDPGRQPADDHQRRRGRARRPGGRVRHQGRAVRRPDRAPVPVHARRPQADACSPTGRPARTARCSRTTAASWCSTTSTRRGEWSCRYRLDAAVRALTEDGHRGRPAGGGRRSRTACATAATAR